MDRVQEAFQYSVRNLLDHSTDWGLWEDVNKFVASPSQEFIDENLTYQTIAPLEFKHIAFLGKDLALVYGVEANDEEERVEPLSQTTIQTLIQSKIFRKIASKDAKEVGAFVTLGDRQFIVAASPIRTTSSEDVNGVIFITREIDDVYLAQIQSMTKIAVAATPHTGDAQALTPGETIVPFEGAFSPISLREDTDTIRGLSTIHDITGRPFLSLDATFPREIYRKGLATEQFFATMFLLVFGASGAAILILMRSHVIAPVRRVSAKLRSIATDSHFQGRVEVHSSDEIGLLGQQINETLTTLQTALTQAEEAQVVAEAANRSKSSFIAKVSHELRTPIHSITGMLRILLKEERTSSKRNYIMMARNSAYGLLETINEILDFSKAEANRLVLERIEFSPHQIIRESLQTVGPRIEEHGSLEAIVEISQGIPNKFYGDPLRLRQVLVNLLGNATKFTKEGHVGLRVNLLSCKHQHVTLEITVFDTGVGIPEDRLDHIFEPFGQADESVSRMFTGTGLGLTIVKQFIEAMGGTVRVESVLGVGSQFILTIPFDVCPDATPIVYKPTLSPPRVAIIDKDSRAVESYRSELERNGYQADLIRSDDTAGLQKISTDVERYGMVIVTSEALKRSRVFDLVLNLRGRDQLPVVSVLSSFEISVRERLLALEVPFVVTRPISLTDILGVVEGSLSPNSEAWEDAEDTFLHAQRPLEILVADDAPTNRIILTELLRDAGHTVVCVENGVEMVARIRHAFEGSAGAPKFDLILTDVQMPLLDGLSATRQIRGLERESGATTHLPIVAVTAHAMTDEISRMREYGVDDVVTKPLDPLKLGEVIQRLTGQQTVSTATEDRATQAIPASSTQDLVELALRLWRHVARRKSDVSELFGLSDDPTGPEDLQRVLDIPDVLERSGDSVRRTLLIFRGFMECFREQLVRLGEAKQAENSEEIRFAAHALKGMLLDVGARISGDLASSIEHLAKQGEIAEAASSINQLTKQTLMVSRLVGQIARLADSPEKNTGVGSPLSISSPSNFGNMD